MNNLDCYAALGVAQNATKKEIKQAYHRQAKLYHPDRNPDDANAEFRFKQLSLAYEILKDDKKRRKYDEMSAAAAAPPPRPETPRPEAPNPKYTSASFDEDYAPRGRGGRTGPSLDFDFSMFQDDEALRHAIAIVLGIIATILIFGSNIFSLLFVLLGVPFAGLVIYHFREDLSYLICVAATRHLIAAWVFVMMAVVENVYVAHYTQFPAINEHSSSVFLAPIHLLFFVSYVMSYGGWQLTIKGGLLLWVASFFTKKLMLSGWILFGVLFLVTCIARFDDALMSDFVIYYYNLFALTPVKAP